MILMITKENEKLISEVCLENNIEDYQILTTVANLYNFTVTELKSLNNFTQLVIDITSINDTEKQLIDKDILDDIVKNPWNYNFPCNLDEYFE